MITLIMGRRMHKILQFRLMEQRRSMRKSRRRKKVTTHRKRLLKLECDMNCQRNKYKTKQIKRYFEKKRFRNYKTRTAPRNFSIVDNSEEVVRFCNSLRKDYYNRRKVFVNMEQVSKLTNESLCLLLSNMMLFRDGKVDFNGNYPIDQSANQIVVESGFLETLYRKGKGNRINKVESPIYTHSAQKSNTDIVDAVVLSCSEFLWGEKYYCSGVYNAMIELMSNTIEHADEIEGRQKWWMTATKDEHEEKVSFSFLDYGRGIIRTLTSANQKRHLNIVKRLLDKWFGDESMLLKEVMEGALTLSEKDGTNYGNGLNSIYLDMIDGQIDNIIIISNNVFADVKNGDYHKMKESFQGTFVSWDINKKSKHENICSNSIYEEIGS